MRDNNVGPSGVPAQSDRTDSHTGKVIDRLHASQQWMLNATLLNHASSDADPSVIRLNDHATTLAPVSDLVACGRTRRYAVSGHCRWPVYYGRGSDNNTTMNSMKSLLSDGEWRRDHASNSLVKTPAIPFRSLGHNVGGIQ
jgi:hypothetical protein